MQDKTADMEATSKIIFDDDEDLGVQNSALQSYLLPLETYLVKLGALGAGNNNYYTLVQTCKRYDRFWC